LRNIPLDKIRFDSSLGIFVETLLQFYPTNILEQSVFIRDINGQLAVILATDLSEGEIAQVSAEMTNKLGAYARSYSLVADQNGFGAAALFAEAITQSPSLVAGTQIRLLDRRAVGIDWLNPPSLHRSGSIPCFVFASIKGGVGRSTALCVAAAYFSRRGRRVLAIDFDIEAPGIGSMLLHENELPQFGSLDFLVESQVGGFDADLIPEMIGSSYLGNAGARVDVLPAIGKATLDFPQNALAKIARAYLEMFPANGGAPITLGDKLKKLVELCESTKRYDVILVDSRAGLHESTAAAMLSLGGEVLLFGINQPQTFQGYKLLFAHLAQFSNNSSNDWQSRFSFVHAKAGRNDKAKQDVAEKFKDLYRLLTTTSVSTPRCKEETITADDIDFVWDDSQENDLGEELPECRVMHILDDGQYRDFDPISRSDLLDFSSYEHTFSDLIQYLDEETSNWVEVN